MRCQFFIRACNPNIRYDNNYSIPIHTLFYPTSTPSAISSPNLIRLYVIDPMHYFWMRRRSCRPSAYIISHHPTWKLEFKVRGSWPTWIAWDRETRDSIHEGVRERNPIAMFAVRDAIPIASWTPVEGVGKSGSRDVRLFIVVIVFRPYLSLATPPPASPQPPLPLSSRWNPICNGNAVFNAALILRPA